MTNPIYIQNKYNTWYHNIIANAQSEDRAKGNGQYFENHHIIPKSFNSTNQKLNLVLLTAREHFICHALLVRFTKGKNKAKMIYAFHIISTSKQEKRHYNNSRLYETNKIKLSKLVSENMKGKKFSKESRLKMSISKKGKNHPMYGKKIPKKTRAKISQANSGKKRSEETKLKIGAASKNRKHSNKSINKRKGKNNWKFNGYYITPYGKFESKRLAVTDLISYNAIYNWCKKYPNKIISKYAIAKSEYLKRLPESPLGKTFREIGFYFESNHI